MASDKNIEEICQSCETSKKLDLLVGRNEFIYTALVEKIETLNTSITSFTSMIHNHEVSIATLNQSITSLNNGFRSFIDKNAEDHNQIHAKINREVNVTCKEVKNDCYARTEVIENRLFDTVKEVHQIIGKKTMLPVIFSICSLIIMVITVIVTYTK